LAAVVHLLAELNLLAVVNVRNFQSHDSRHVDRLRHFQASPHRSRVARGDELSLVRTHCAGCHTTNQKAVAHLDLSDLSNLDCDTRLAMVAAVADGSMPKGKKLDGQTMGDLIGQLSYAKTAPNAGVKPQPAPVVEQLEVAPEPPKPEPEKPVVEMPKWKFNEGDWVVDVKSTARCKITERHRTQHLGTGKITNVYTCVFSRENMPDWTKDIEEDWLKAEVKAEAVAEMAEGYP